MEEEEKSVTPKAGGRSIAGLVLGVVSVVMFLVGFATFWSWLLGLIMSVVGMVLSIVGYKKEGKTGIAIAGLVLSIIALVINVILFIACGICVIAAAGTVAAAM